MSKRGRACEACSRIKIKCELGANRTKTRTTGVEPPCERCLRLNKQCVLSQPKRQKDRVAELEAQVEALTRLLQAQGIQQAQVPLASETQAPSSAVPVTATNTMKLKRRRVDGASSPSGSSDSSSLSVVALDQFVSHEAQQRLLRRYCDQQLIVFPLVPISGDCSLASLRAERLVLLYAVVYAAGPGILSLDTQERIAKVFFDHLTTVALSPKSHSLDTIQAILITSLFYRSPRHRSHLSVFGLIEVGLQLVSKLDHKGTLSPPVEPHVSVHDDTDVDSIDASRAIMVSHLLATAMSIFTRRKRPVHWTKEHDTCVLQLQYSPTSKPTDPWLSQLIRAEHVCEQIAEQMDFWDAASHVALSDPAMRLKTQTCRNLILNFRITIPAHLRTPTLYFWENLATAYMHEAVLHTATNKLSFAAPFVAENLSVSDFPAPAEVTQDHITALFELTTAVQTMIDLYSNLDTETLAAMPGFLHSSRAAYALFILAKLHVATMAPGNTFGAVLDGNMILLEDYANKLIENGSKIRALDERCAPARILFAAVGVREWYLNFTSSISPPFVPLYHHQQQEQQQQELGVSQMAANTIAVAPALAIPPVDSLDFDSTQFGAVDDWEKFFYYSSNTADFGLDMLFDQEPRPFREKMYDDAAYQAQP